MSHTLTLRISDDLSDRLDRLAESTSRPKSFYVRTLLEEHLSELELVAGLDRHAEALRGGLVEARPIHDLVSELGLDAVSLLEEGRKELGM